MRQQKSGMTKPILQWPLNLHGEPGKEEKHGGLVSPRPSATSVFVCAGADRKSVGLALASGDKQQNYGGTRVLVWLSLFPLTDPKLTTCFQSSTPSNVRSLPLPQRGNWGSKQTLCEQFYFLLC